MEHYFALFVKIFLVFFSYGGVMPEVVVNENEGWAKVDIIIIVLLW